MVHKPEPQEFLIDVFGIFPGGKAFLVGFFQPIAARIRGMDFIDEADDTVGVPSEFVLGIDQDQTSLGCFGLPNANSSMAAREVTSQSASFISPISSTSSGLTGSSWMSDFVVGVKMFFSNF